MFRVVVYCGLLAVCWAQGNFTFTDCTNSSNPLVTFNNINISSLHFPGNITGSLELNLLQPISGEHHEVRVHLQKKVLFGFIDVPCNPTGGTFLSRIGSCTYQVCEILNASIWANNQHHCPIEIATTSPDLECACPFKPGVYHLNPTTAFVSGLGISKFAAQGDFAAKITVVDTNIKEEVGCFIIHAKTETDCEGIACLVGR